MSEPTPIPEVPITGFIARRILCFPEVGEWVRRGGLVKGGSSVVARLEETA